MAVLTLVLSLANIPQNIKPIESELNVFTNHLTGILLRHLPIAKGFSADALDIIGLFAVMSGYYARIAPELKAKQVTTTYPQPIPESLDPITNLSPEAGQFLDAASRKKVSE